jgi:hypothetical protein
VILSGKYVYIFFTRAMKTGIKDWNVAAVINTTP